MANRNVLKKRISDLRKQAEASLGENLPAAEGVTALSRMEMEKLVHELRVHQVELELQNEELQMAQDLLSESRDRYSDLYDFAPVGYLTLDRGGRILEINLTGAALLATDRPPMIGKPFQSFLVEEYSGSFFLHKQEAFETRSRQRCEVKLRRADGTTFDAQLESLAAVDVDGQLTRCRTIVFDITERKRAEAALLHLKEEQEKLEIQLRHAQKLEALGTLAGGIAHDFNNILSIVLGYTEMAISQIPAGSPVYSYLDTVVTASLRAKELVQQILIFGRPGDMQQRHPVEIGPIVMEAVRFLRATLPATIQLRQEISEGSAMVMGDPTQIHQVIVNLCTNAAHAMEDRGGLMEVSLANVELETPTACYHGRLGPGSYVRLTVKDTGNGMDAATMERIFDPYFTTKKMGKGSGLGLAVVHGIVKRHEASIAVWSELDEGTTFELCFPKIALEKARDSLPREPVRSGKEHILFVDDEEALMMLGKIMLLKLGYRVSAARSSDAALELFCAQPEAIDLVITDYTMPQMTGVALAAKMLKIRPNLRIILCSGYSDMLNQTKAKELGLRAFVKKPASQRELAEVVRKVLDEG